MNAAAGTAALSLRENDDDDDAEVERAAHLLALLSHDEQQRRRRAAAAVASGPAPAGVPMLPVFMAMPLTVYRNLGFPWQ